MAIYLESLSSMVHFPFNHVKELELSHTCAKRQVKVWGRFFSVVRSMGSNLSNSGLFIRTNKYQQIKRDRHQENENLVESSIQLQWQTGSPVHRVAKEISQNTGS